MDNSSSIVNDAELLSESELRELGKGFAAVSPRGGSSVPEDWTFHMLSLYPRLLRTVDTSRLSCSHAAAATDALCGFLKMGSISSHDGLNGLCLDLRTWKDVFSVYLRSSQTRKSKPARQLLLTLMHLRSKNPDSHDKIAEIDFASIQAAQIICSADQTASVKSAFQTLEYVLSNCLISALGIIRLVAQIQTSQAGSFLRVVLSTPRDQHRVLLESDALDSASMEVFQSFIYDVLIWLHYPDTAAAAGRLVSAFIKSFRSSLPGEANMATSALSICIRLLVCLLNDQPHMRNVIKNSVLPELLRLHHADVMAILEPMRLLNMSPTNIGQMCNAEIEIRLLAAEVAEASGVSPGIESTSQAPEEFAVSGTEALGITMLAHSSVSIRIHALSLLSRSKSPKEPLSRNCLLSLQNRIAHFHAEVDPKARNDFIPLAKKLFLRVMNVIMAQSGAALIPPTTPEAINFAKHSTLGHDTLHRYNIVSEVNCTEQHTIFIRWYMLFLAKELQPTASYQRHITALEILQWSTRECSSVLLGLVALDEFLDRPEASYTDELVNPLFSLIMDPFDDVRTLATSTLLFILEGLKQKQRDVSMDFTKDLATMTNPLVVSGSPGNLSFSLHRAERTTRATGRADHADGLARLNLLRWQLAEDSGQGCNNRTSLLEVLVSDLEADLGTAHSNLSFAVANAPLHGRIIALRHIVNSKAFYFSISNNSAYSQWPSLKDRLISCCVDVWEVVKSTLSCDSPEGHLDDADLSDIYDIGPKDTLSFCWRALKESSLLIHALLLQAGTNPQAPVHGLDHKDFERLGSLSFTQLGELRHKGAFSTVAQTFALCCVQCAQNYNVKIRQLPELWYQQVLLYIYQHASALTRKSAGLPAMVTGILAAYPQGEFFGNVVSELQAIARTPLNNAVGSEELLLPQVHALNCLKDVFSDARFRDSVERHVPDTLNLAASCLDAEIWGIRNSGLMLLNSLLRRLNGGTDTNSSKASSAGRRLSPLTYERYPNIAVLVTRLLSPCDHSFNGVERQATSGSGILTAQTVFPALEIIERFGIPKERRAEIRDLIEYHMRGPVWPIREKAAKAFAYAIHDKEVAVEAEELLKAVTASKCTQNALHGRLLCVRYLFARLGTSLSVKLAVNDRRLEEQVLNACDYFIVFNECPITTATYFNIIADVLENLVTRKEMSAVNFASIVQCKARFLQLTPTTETNPPGVYSPLDASLQLAFKRCRSLIQQTTKLKSNEMAFPSAVSQLAKLEILQQIQQGLFSYEILETVHGVSSRNYGSKDSSAWFCWLRLAGQENADLSTRLAAADSLRSFMSTHDEEACQIRTEHDLIRFYLAVYDRLIDDDEDVRTIGAKLVSEILCKTPNDKNGPAITGSLSVSAARTEFLRFLERYHGESPYLSCEALRRLACDSRVRAPDADIERPCIDSPVSDSAADEYDESTIVLFRPFQDELGDAMKLNTTLFVEEKQNLYIDEVEEARAWSQILIDMQLWRVGANLTSRFYDWAISGLHTLIAAATREIDGPLGWTSKPEVFTTGMRAILAAKVITHVPPQQVHTTYTPLYPQPHSSITQIIPYQTDTMKGNLVIAVLLILTVVLCPLLYWLLLTVARWLALQHIEIERLETELVQVRDRALAAQAADIEASRAGTSAAAASNGAAPTTAPSPAANGGTANGAAANGAPAANGGTPNGAKANGVKINGKAGNGAAAPAAEEVAGASPA